MVHNGVTFLYLDIYPRQFVIRPWKQTNLANKELLGGCDPWPLTTYESYLNWLFHASNSRFCGSFFCARVPYWAKYVISSRLLKFLPFFLKNASFLAKSQKSLQRMLLPVFLVAQQTKLVKLRFQLKISHRVCIYFGIVIFILLFPCPIPSEFKTTLYSSSNQKSREATI